MHRQHVRPWALASPILVLLLALPMLRPLRSPAAVSSNELSRLATVQSIVEQHTLAINDSTFMQTLCERTRFIRPTRYASGGNGSAIGRRSWRCCWPGLIGCSGKAG